MTVRAVVINNKGQSYEAASISADNDNFISDHMVLPHLFWAACMRVPKYDIALSLRV